LGGDIIDIQLEQAASLDIVQELKKFKEVVDVLQLKPSNIRIYLNSVEEVIPKIVNMLTKKDSPIVSLRMTEPSLDDVFVHYTGLTIEEAQKSGE
jgi:ABC-2 type transport system ATP-binding protein